MLRDKRIVWGGALLICMTLSLLLIQPGSVMLADSARLVAHSSMPSSVSLKQLQSSSAPAMQGEAESSPAQYTGDSPESPLATQPEPTAESTPVVATSTPAPVAVIPLASPTPTIASTPPPPPASPTPTPHPSPTPIASPSATPPSSATPTITIRPPLQPAQTP